MTAIGHCHFFISGGQPEVGDDPASHITLHFDRSERTVLSCDMAPGRVRAPYQFMHQFVAKADRSDDPDVMVDSGQVYPRVKRYKLKGVCTVDDTGVPKKDTRAPLGTTSIGFLEASRLPRVHPLLLRGEAQVVSRFAEENRLIPCEEKSADDFPAALFNAQSGFAEVLIPPRSSLIGDAMFPEMITPSGDLMVLAIQRRGENLQTSETTLAAGDTLLLQGNWAALDEHLRDPDVVLVNQPDLVRRQTVEFGTHGRIAIVVLLAMGFCRKPVRSSLPRL
jgi:hypothetical protein